MTERRPYFWRMLRQDFIDMCDRNGIAALLLDYFYSNEVNSMGRRSQGGRDDGYYELSASFATAIVLLDVSKNTAKAALHLLILKGFITPHPENGRAGWQNRNRYRPNLRLILQAADEWAVSHPGIVGSALQMVVPDQSIGQIRPINTSNETNQLVTLDQSIGQIRPQDLVSKEVKESTSSSSSSATTTMTTLIQLFTDWKARKPTSGELNVLNQLATEFTPEAVASAMLKAVEHGGKELPYIRSVLQNGDAPRPGAPAKRKSFVAPEPSTGPRMTADEMRAMRREIEARRRLNDEGAS